jgi:hypothetical protein
MKVLSNAPGLALYACPAVLQVADVSHLASGEGHLFARCYLCLFELNVRPESS